jgi:hypothetical protein
MQQDVLLQYYGHIIRIHRGHHLKLIPRSCKEKMTGMEEFYVITDTGMCVYSKAKDGHQTQDVDLVAGYINALNAFSLQVAQDHIRSIHLGKSKLIINHRHGMQFVARVGREARTANVRKNLQDFSGRFFKMFPPEFIAKKWRGNMACFEKIDSTFHQSFHEFCAEMRIAM